MRSTVRRRKVSSVDNNNNEGIYRRNIQETCMTIHHFCRIHRHNNSFALIVVINASHREYTSHLTEKNKISQEQNDAHKRTLINRAKNDATIQPNDDCDDTCILTIKLRVECKSTSRIQKFDKEVCSCRSIGITSMRQNPVTDERTPQGHSQR